MGGVGEGVMWTQSVTDGVEKGRGGLWNEMKVG